jgi:hypothetical protein
MAITWSDAIADVDNADDAARYDRAVQQVRELDGLVQSFAAAVIESGKWPMEARGEYDVTLVPTSLRTAFREPLVWVYPDGTWGLDAGGVFGYLVKLPTGGVPDFYRPGRTSVISSPDFDARMVAIDDSKNWVPRELVAYLRRNGIDIPSDG